MYVSAIGNDWSYLRFVAAVESAVNSGGDPGQWMLTCSSCAFYSVGYSCLDMLKKTAAGRSSGA